MLAPNPVVSNLRAARHWITPPDKWIAGYRHWNGRHCALGALEGVGLILSDDNVPEVVALAAAARCLEPNLGESVAAVYGSPKWTNMATVACFNNQKGHQATLRMFDKAIEISLPPVDTEATKETEDA